jgi:hypothetical protein
MKRLSDEDFIKFLVEFRYPKPDTLRLGQWAMFILCGINTEVYNQITGTENDPFYNDNKLPQFFNTL